MSKRPGAVSAETRERILAAAREEFRARGFQGSSLRRICSEAGVTTGALYFFFVGKDELFQKVLAEVTEPVARLLEKHYASEEAPELSPEGADADLEVTRRLIDLYFSNRQTWDILLAHRNHPAVKSFLEGCLRATGEHYGRLLPGVDAFALGQFVRMQTDSMLALLSQDFSREDMILHSRTVIRMLRGAFQALTDR